MLQIPDLDLDKIINRVDSDDEFFNVMCHIDPTLKHKIEKGEFVDLERLLPKESGGACGVISSTDENKVELVSKGGHTYFKPVKDTHINGLCKWEQAFRVYAAIYSKANPERAVEVWQYMHVINVVASAYQWSNVAYYDMTFRQLMEFNPNRSWSKTYNQGWNLTLKEPLGPKQNHYQERNNDELTRSQGKQHNWRDDCCWKFNKNRCRHPNCDFDHRCTFCGGWNHGFYNCRKRLGKKKQHHNESRRSSSPSKWK